LVLILDEFPILVEKFPEVLSILQDKWDNLLKKTKIKLILCGSSVGMMEKYTLSYKSPLYGRRTGQWNLQKLEIKYLKDFFPSYNIKDLLLVFSCVDTIPGYLVKFSPDENVWSNIRDRILTKGEFLYEEVEILLREELRDPSNYMSIISSIAGGLTSFSEIAARTRLDKSLLSKYLYTLENLGIIKKIMPVTETFKSRLKAKGAKYYIKDNFFDFWFRFVFLNKSELEQGNVSTVLKNIKKEINPYLSIKFESFVEKAIPSLKIIRPTRIGKWWHKENEIDVLALDEIKKHVLFCECKWKENVDAEKEAKKLIDVSPLVEWHKKERKEFYAIFAKSFKRKINFIEKKRVVCFDLKALESSLFH